MPAQSVVVGVRLRHYTQVWVEHVSDPWVVSTVSFGLSGGSRETPKRSFPSDQRRKIMVKYIMDLLQKHAILEVPIFQHGRGFYCPLLLVRKKNHGDLRPVLNLKGLNKSICPDSFKMESLKSILLTVSLGVWMLSVDLSNAYLHVPIYPNQRRL